MSDEDRQPSLEPPKLFGRRRKDVPEDSEPELSDEPTAAIPDPVPAPEPAPHPDPIPEPEPAPIPEPTPIPEPGPGLSTRRAPLPVDLPSARDEPPVARTLVTGVPLFADEVPPEPLEGEEEAEAATEEARASERRAKSRRVPRGPVLTGYPASALTGLLVGLLMVGLTVASLRGCEAIRGTSTCGGPGLLVLVIILVLLVMLGQVLLKALRVPDPGSTSFLAVGLIAVVALLFLIDVILDWQMVIVIPLVGMASFLLSHWVTTAFVETDH